MRRAGDGHAHLHVAVAGHCRLRPHGQDVHTRVLDRAGEGQRAALDHQLLPVRRIGAVFDPDGAVEHRPVRRGRDLERPRQEGVQPHAFDAQPLAQVHVQIGHQLALGRALGATLRRRVVHLGHRARVRRAVDDRHIVAHRGGRGLTDVDQALVHPGTALQLDQLCPQSGIDVPADHHAPVYPLQQREAVGRQAQARLRDLAKAALPLRGDQATGRAAAGLEMLQHDQVAAQ